jgi:hypothetical protein
VILVACYLPLGLGPCGGQTPTPSPLASPSADTTSKSKDTSDQTQDPDAAAKQKRGSWILAPIPINSPTFGAGIVLVAGYVFSLQKDDTVSPKSVIGGVAAFTNNGSRGGAFGGHLYFSQNRYQATFAGGKGRANYKFFGIGRVPGQAGRSVFIRQSGQFVFAEFMRNVWRNIFIGPRYQYRKLTARQDETNDGVFQIPSLDLQSTTAAIGFHIQRDVRDSIFYPTKGSLFDTKADFFAKPLGSNRDYQTYSISYNGYRSIGKREVIAYRGVVCSVSDNTPFFDLCLYGARSDIRGYTAGEFQDHRMFAVQAEYRRELFWRLGAVAFGGFGGIARHWDEFRSDKLLPGGGVGLRLKLDKANHINYRIDLGFGRAGSTLSFSISEAF